MSTGGTVAIQTPEMAHEGEAQGAIMPSEGSIVYQRADGTVELATSREDAIARCPVLGKMPVEEAEILLELAAEGNEQLEKEAQETAIENESKLRESGNEETDEVEDRAPEPISTQFDREDAAAQENLQRMQALDRRPSVLRKQFKPKEIHGRALDIDSLVGRVIAANPQASKAFRRGDDSALDILVGEAKKLSKAAK